MLPLHSLRTLVALIYSCRQAEGRGRSLMKMFKYSISLKMGGLEGPGTLCYMRTSALSSFPTFLSSFLSFFPCKKNSVITQLGSFFFFLMSASRLDCKWLTNMKKRFNFNLPLHLPGWHRIFKMVPSVHEVQESRHFSYSTSGISNGCNLFEGQYCNLC